MKLTCEFVVVVDPDVDTASPVVREPTNIPAGVFMTPLLDVELLELSMLRDTGTAIPKTHIKMVFY